MKTLHDIVTMEQKVAEMLSDLVSRLASDTREAKVDGVRKMGKNAVVVSVSRLDMGILDPSYYIQEKQSDIVEQKLRTAKTATDFMDRLREMVDNKCVKVGNEKVRLNPKTIEILTSYIENA